MTNSFFISSHKTTLINVFEEELDPDRRKYFLLGMLAAATSQNDHLGLNEWMSISKGILDQEEVEETLLQTLLFVGFPKTIEALKIMRQHFTGKSSSKDVVDSQKAGMATSQLVYGKHHPRLLEVMNDLHPDLTRWMIEDGYGRTLSRPGLKIHQREMAVVASLMATGMINQFRAHIRGALLAGVTPVDINWFTNIFKCIIAANTQESFEQVKQQILNDFIEK